MTFTHADEGTPEPVWAQAIAEHRLDDVSGLLAEIDHLVVVAAHPDDETLGTAGLLARAYGAGVRATVVVATSGEASHPGSPTHGPAELARLRERETVDAVAEVHPGAVVEFLRLPDGGLGADGIGICLESAVAAVLDADPGFRSTDGAALDPRAATGAGPHERDAGGRDALGQDVPAGPGLAQDRPDAAPAQPGARALVLAPWSGDRHPDHEAAARAARAAADAAGAQLLEYPIWLWHWAGPDDESVPWSELVAVPLDADVREAKLRALAHHVSQVAPLSEQAGDEALLQPGMLAHFDREAELFVRSRTAHPESVAPEGVVGAEYFDGLHAGSADPWGFETRWYEERKRAVLLASLPERRFGAVLEVGSSTGVLSLELAARAETSFLGVDVSEVAVRRARERAVESRSDGSAASALLPRFERMRVPHDWPDGPFDLVVVSEIGYYLEPDELELLARRIDSSLTARGVLVCCHWRHPVAGRPLGGDAVNALFAGRAGFATLARHLEEDFVLDVLVREPAVSVARREGVL